MLLRLYMPTFRWQLLAYFLLSLCMAGLMALGKAHDFILVSTTVCSFVLGTAYYLAPLVLCIHDYRPVCNTLPVTAGEKMAMLLIYFCAITFIALYGPYYLLYVIFPDALPTYSEIVGHGVDFNLSPWQILLQSLGAVAVVLVVIWGVLSAKGNRILKGICSLVCFIIIEGFISGMAGMAYALSRIDEIKADPEALVAMPEFLDLTYMIVLAIVIITTSIFLPLIYRNLKHRGF